MRKKREIILTATALLLTAAALAALAGCNKGPKAQFADQPASVVASESAAALASSAPAAAAAAGSGSTGSRAGSSSSAGSSKLTTKDASTLDAELSAIQSELDRLSVPSDSDFDSLGSGLQ